MQKFNAKTKGKNSGNEGGSVMVLVHCTFSIMCSISILSFKLIDVIVSKIWPRQNPEGYSRGEWTDGQMDGKGNSSILPAPPPPPQTWEGRKIKLVTWKRVNSFLLNPNF